MLEEKNEKKLAIWKEKSLSIAGRTTLFDSSLSNSFIYHMSMYLLLKTTTDKLDQQRRTFYSAIPFPPTRASFLPSNGSNQPGALLPFLFSSVELLTRDKTVRQGG